MHSGRRGDPPVVIPKQSIRRPITRQTRASRDGSQWTRVRLARALAFTDLVEEAAGFCEVLDHAFRADKSAKNDGSEDCMPEHWDQVMFKGYWLRTKDFGWE